MNTWEAIVLLIFAILFRLFLKPFLRRLALKTRSTVDERIIDAVANPLWFIVLLAVADYFAYTYGAPAWVPLIGKSLIAILSGVIAYRLVRILLFDVFAKRTSKLLDRRTRDTALRAMHNIFLVLIVFLVFAYLLVLWGVNVTPLLASAGIAGLAIGLALKDPLENFFYGIILAMDPSFRVDDIVDINGLVGTVYDIGLRNTKILTFSGDLVAIPNAEIARSKIINFHLPRETVRVVTRVGASYDADPERVKEILEKTAKSSKYVLDKPAPQALFIEYGDSALIYELRFWTKLQTRFEALDDVNTKIWKAFKENGIEIPYPIRTVYLRKG